MLEFTRPERHRLERMGKRVEKALDELSRGRGELRPAKFAEVRTTLDRAMSQLEDVALYVEKLRAQPVALGDEAEPALPLDAGPRDPDDDSPQAEPDDDTEREEDDPDGNDEESARRLAAGRRRRAVA